MRRAAAAALVALLFDRHGAGGGPRRRAVDLEARVLPSFRIGHPDITRFGRLEFVGGIEVESSFREVGGLSGLVMDPGGGGFLAISDTRPDLRAELTRDAAPAGGPEGGRLKRIRGLNGGKTGVPVGRRHRGLRHHGARRGLLFAGISFEGRPRVMLGPMDPTASWAS